MLLLHYICSCIILSGYQWYFWFDCIRDSRACKYFILLSILLGLLEWNFHNFWLMLILGPVSSSTGYDGMGKWNSLFIVLLRRLVHILFHWSSPYLPKFSSISSIYSWCHNDTTFDHFDHIPSNALISHPPDAQTYTSTQTSPSDSKFQPTWPPTIATPSPSEAVPTPIPHQWAVSEPNPSNCWQSPYTNSIYSWEARDCWVRPLSCASGS